MISLSNNNGKISNLLFRAIFLKDKTYSSKFSLAKKGPRGSAIPFMLNDCQKYEPEYMGFVIQLTRSNYWTMLVKVIKI